MLELAALAGGGPAGQRPAHRTGELDVAAVRHHQVDPVVVALDLIERGARGDRDLGLLDVGLQVLLRREAGLNQLKVNLESITVGLLLTLTVHNTGM